MKEINFSFDGDEGSQDNHQSIFKSESLSSISPSDQLVQKNAFKTAKTFQLPNQAAISVFVGETFILNHQKEYLNSLWVDIRANIVNTPIEFISSIHE